jgi:hAT family C-terminal dimerisation region
MSAEAERIFSGARRTISWSRFRLGIKVVEQTECLKSWLRTGLVDNWRLANFIEKAKNLDSEGALEAV